MKFRSHMQLYAFLKYVDEMRLRKILLVSLVVLSGSPLFSQNTLFELYRRKSDSTRIEFQNASALFKENGQSYQHVIASYTTSKDGSVIFSHKGKQILSSVLKKGVNRFLLSVPAVNKPSVIKISAKLNNETAKEYPVTVNPVKKWNIYLVQHTHTDRRRTRRPGAAAGPPARSVSFREAGCRAGARRLNAQAERAGWNRGLEPRAERPG